MDKKLLIPAILIIALTVVVISVEIIGNYSPPPSPVSPAKNDLGGRTVTVMTNHPHLGAADALAEWFHEESGAVVRNIVVD